jgi:hypothetical protein
MTATATASRGPKAGKKLTVDQAGEQWVKAKKAIEAAGPKLEEAEEVLLAHFERSGKKTWRDQIVLTMTTSRKILDQDKVKKFLGPKLPKFMKRTKPNPKLSLLE